MIHFSWSRRARLILYVCFFNSYEVTNFTLYVLWSFAQDICSGRKKDVAEKLPMLKFYWKFYNAYIDIWKCLIVSKLILSACILERVFDELLTIFFPGIVVDAIVILKIMQNKDANMWVSRNCWWWHSSLE